LCFNKSDLAVPGELAALRSIYEPLGYSVMIVSAKTGDGVASLGELLSAKISVLAGPSGVGKSSLLNILNPEVILKIGLMENDFGVGRHTTTASELYRLKAVGKAPTWVADTPGFGVSELRHPEPGHVGALFREFAQLSSECRFSDCLHIVEQGCNVRMNIGKISPERYESYGILVAEAQAEQKLQKETSTKVEGKVKLVGGKEGRAKQIPRLNERYRTPSRRTAKQELIATKLEGAEDGDDDFSQEDG
jgi:ribosome biogenesis GTPase